MWFSYCILYLLIFLSISLLVVCLSVCLSVSLFVYLIVWLFFWLTVWLFLYLHVYWFLYLCFQHIHHNLELLIFLSLIFWFFNHTEFLFHLFLSPLIFVFASNYYMRLYQNLTYLFQSKILSTQFCSSKCISLFQNFVILQFSAFTYVNKLN